MRIIPKNSRMHRSVWKSFNIIDILVAFIAFAIIFFIFLSNISGRIYIMIAIAALSVLLFLKNDDIRAYKEILQMFRYFVSIKKFEKKSSFIINNPDKLNKLNKADKFGKHKISRRIKDITALIPYTGILSDGTICFDDYYGRVINIGSVDFRLLNDWMQNFKISMFAGIFNLLSSDQSLQLVKLDQPIIFDNISSKLFNKIQAEEAKETIDPHRLNILRSRLNQIDALNNIELQYRSFFYLVLFDPSKQNLDSTVNNICRIIDEMKMSKYELNLKDTVLFLKYCYSHNFDERDLEDIPSGEYLEYIKPEKVSFKRNTFKIDDINAFSFTVTDYPLSVANAWGASLFNIENTKVVLNIRPVVSDRAIKRVDRTIGELGARSENINKASEYISQNTHLETMGELLQNLQNENENMYDCSLVITGYDNNGSDRKLLMKQTRRKIVNGGFRVNELLARQLEGFVTSNISRHCSLKMFERGINSESLAAVFPFVFTEIIEEEGVTIGQNVYPVVMDIFKRDGDKYTSSNILIIGGPGGGKSFFTKTLLTLLYSDNSQVFILDPENEYTTLARNLGGAVIDVGNATVGRLNPFHIYQILTDDGEPAPPDVVFTSHLTFLESFLNITLPGINQDSLELINNLIPECYKDKGITMDTDCSEFGLERFPVFNDLIIKIRSALEKETNQMFRLNLQRAESYIAKFAENGRYARLWNGSSTLMSNERITVFNFQSLLAGKNNTVANGQMLLTMRYLEQQVINIREHNRAGGELIHPVVALDEGYNFVDPKYPVALDFVYNWEKRIRKYLGSLIFITQNLKDLTGNSEILSKTMAIVNNSQYSFIFRLAPGDVADLIELYSNGAGINETEQNEISQLSRGKAFLISAPADRTVVKIVASDVVQSYFMDAVSG